MVYVVLRTLTSFENRSKSIGGHWTQRLGGPSR